MSVMDLIWMSAATIPAALSAWLAARALEPHLSPRLGVRLWQAARLAAFAPVLVVLSAPLVSGLANGAQQASAPIEPAAGGDAAPVAAPIFQPVIEFAELSLSSLPVALLPLIVGLYLTGLALMAARGVLQRGQIRTLMRASVADDGRLSALAQRWRTRLGLPHTLAPVRVVDAVISPFVVGFKPVILAPDTLYKRDDAEAAIAHELMHIKRGDERDRLIGEALTALIWFNPVYRAIERRLAAARELACDADVLDALGPDQRRPYAEAIAGLAPMPAVATGFLTDLERLRKRRVEAALSHTGTKPRALAAVLAGAAILLAGAPSAALAVMLSGQEVQGAETRVLSEAVGEQVMAAQEAAQAEDHLQALDILNAIEPTSSYDRFIVEQLLGRAYFELDDLPGSIEAFEAALESGGANEEEGYSVATAIFQLNLVLEDYWAVRRWLQYLTQHDERMTPQMQKAVAQAYLQMVEYEAALPYAEAARAGLAEDDLDLLHVLFFLYQETGRQAEMDALRAYLQENHPDSIVLQ